MNTPAEINGANGIILILFFTIFVIEKNAIPSIQAISNEKIVAKKPVEKAITAINFTSPAPRPFVYFDTRQRIKKITKAENKRIKITSKLEDNRREKEIIKIEISSLFGIRSKQKS